VIIMHFLSLRGKMRRLRRDLPEIRRTKQLRRTTSA